MFSSFSPSIRKIRKAVDKKLYEKTRTRTLIFWISITIALFLIIGVSLIPKRVDVQVGDIAQEEIRATKDIVDETTTERYRMEAMENVDPKYIVDTSVQIKIKDNIGSFFNLLNDTRLDETISQDEKVEKLNSQNYVSLEEGKYNLLLNSPKQDIELLESNIYEVLNQIMNMGIKEEDIDYAKNNVESIFSRIPNLDQDLKAIATSIVNKSIKANKFLDVEATNAEREKAAESIEPVVIKSGEAIVDRNEIISENDYELLKGSGLVEKESSTGYKIIIGALIITVIIELIVGGYLYYFEREVYANQKLMTVMAIIVFAVILISRSLSIISGYLMPVATATILISILINRRVAIIVNILMGILLIITTEVDTSIVVITFLGGVVGSFASINTQQRSSIMITGSIISMLGVAFVIAFGLVDDLGLGLLSTRVIYVVISGLLSAILAIGSMPIWENIFGILTSTKLLELMNPNQPLLKRLLTEAPGTYYHSVLVGNLAENAAEEVGANSLLVRVGAYYHDIGKMKRPYFFKENQIGIENPHDNISPNLSAIIITNHTKDGVKLSDECSLPRPIRDIIIEHHGTTMATYFYHKAMNEEGVDSNTILESRYRYTGPKPQSKEAAIVMLADSIEAASRSMKETEKSRIENMIKNIVKGKIDDGQLDECDLTLEDIRNLEKSFLKTIMGMYHDRIEYPDISDIREEK